MVKSVPNSCFTSSTFPSRSCNEPYAKMTKVHPGTSGKTIVQAGEYIIRQVIAEIQERDRTAVFQIGVQEQRSIRTGFDVRKPTEFDLSHYR